MEEYLRPTQVIEGESPVIKQKASELTAGLQTDRGKAVAFFYFVRDGIRHNPYAAGQILENYRATETLERGSGHCEHKAIVLAALCRAAGIPARLGYVDIRDELLSDKFRQMIGGDNLLIQHGYVEIYIDGKWVHASPAYDLPTCEKAGFVPVEFDGVNDAKDSPCDRQGRPHVRHVKDHGCFADFPWDFIVSYRKEWVERIGRGWNEFTDNVRNMEVD